MAIQRDRSLVSQFKSFMRSNESRYQGVLAARMKAQLPMFADTLIRQASGFINRTGNTMNGFFVGAYLPINGAMELVGSAFSSDNPKIEEPTRATLKKGEMYDLDVYWRGEPVVGKPFVGIFGTRNFISFEESMRFLQNHAPHYCGMGFIVGNSVNYGKFIEVHKHGNLISQFCEDFRKKKGWKVEIHGK